MGLAVGAVPFDEDGDGKNDMVIFSLGAVMAEGISKLFPDFLPQGLHALRWIEDTEAYRVDPLETYPRLRYTATDKEDPPPVSLGFSWMEKGTGREAGDLLAMMLHRFDGQTFAPPALHLFLPRRGLDRGFQVLQGAAAWIATGDLDGDGFDEIATSNGEGAIQILGLGPKVPPLRPDLAALRQASSAQKEALRLRVGQRLLDLGFPAVSERVFADLVPDVRDTPREDEAYRGRISAQAALRQYDECVTLCEEWQATPRGHDRRASLPPCHVPGAA